MGQSAYSIAMQQMGELIDKANLNTEALEVALEPINEQLAETVKKGELVYNVKDYGAKGDYDPGTATGTNDTAAFQACIDAAKVVGGTVFAPPVVGGYLINGQLIIDGAVTVQGDRSYNQGSKLYTLNNSAMFYVTSTARFQNLNIIGDGDAAKTLQDGIFIDDISNVDIIECFFDKLYNGIHVKDTVFYSSITGCRFYSAGNAFIYGEGTSSPGYQIQINNCVASVDVSKYGFYFANAGTVTINDLEMSPGNCTDGGVVFASNAVNAGIHQITHSRLEGSQTNGLQLIGDALSPIKYVFVDNTYIAGNSSVYIDCAYGVYFSNCYFTGSAGGGPTKNAISVLTQGEGIFLSNCEFQVTDVVLTAGVDCTSISYHVTNPNYNGASQFIYLPFLNPSVVKRISVVGGRIGTNALPLDLPSYAPSTVSADVPGYAALASHGLKVFNGDGGIAIYNIPHGLVTTPSYVSVIAGSNDAAAALVYYIERNSTNIVVSLKNFPTPGTNNLVFYWAARV